MKTSKLITLSLFALCFIGIIVDSSFASPVPNGGCNPCCATAAVTREALVSEVARVHSVESHIDTSQGGTCVIVKFPSPPAES